MITRGWCRGDRRWFRDGPRDGGREGGGDASWHQHYTLGQRKGLGVAFGHPVFVTRIDAGTNTVVVGKREELLHRSWVAAR